MKIRSGFVSNSSSSSFVLMYKEYIIDTEDVLDFIEKNPDVPVVIQYDFGASDTYNTHVLTPYQRRYLLKHKEEILKTSVEMDCYTYAKPLATFDNEIYDIELPCTKGKMLAVTWKDYCSWDSDDYFKESWDAVLNEN